MFLYPPMLLLYVCTDQTNQAAFVSPVLCTNVTKHSVVHEVIQDRVFEDPAWENKSAKFFCQKKKTRQNADLDPGEAELASLCSARV